MRPLSPIQAALLRRAAALSSGRGRKASLLVLMYHRVLPAPDPLLPDEPDAATFATQVDLLADNFNVLPLAEACERLKSGSLPDRAICITFDDGYANNLTVAAPILQQRKLPATVFIATGFLDGGRMFNDTVIEAVRRAGPSLDLSPLGLGRFDLSDVEARRFAIRRILSAIKYRPPEERLGLAARIAESVGTNLPNDLMLTSQQVRRLPEAGIEVGAHTVNHPILTSVPDDRATTEILDSKVALESIIGEPVTSFAYPNGGPNRDYSGIHVAMARQAGFRRAVSTADGAATVGSDELQLPRIMPWYGSGWAISIRFCRTFRLRGFPTT